MASKGESLVKQPKIYNPRPFIIFTQENSLVIQKHYSLDFLSRHLKNSNFQLDICVRRTKQKQKINRNKENKTKHAQKKKLKMFRVFNTLEYFHNE